MRTVKGIRLGWATLVLVPLACSAGCDDQLDPAKYGKVIYEIPKIEGADKPHPLPGLDQNVAQPHSVEK